MVEENGGSVSSGVDPLAPTSDTGNALPIVSSVQSAGGPHLVAATSIVQLTIPTHTQQQVFRGTINTLKLMPQCLSYCSFWPAKINLLDLLFQKFTFV